MQGASDYEYTAKILESSVRRGLSEFSRELDVRRKGYRHISYFQTELSSYDSHTVQHLSNNQQVPSRMNHRKSPGFYIDRNELVDISSLIEVYSADMKKL